jgi:hypothetical protein
MCVHGWQECVRLSNSLHHLLLAGCKDGVAAWLVLFTFPTCTVRDSTAQVSPHVRVSVDPM